jgi:hypothetical protein
VGSWHILQIFDETKKTNNLAFFLVSSLTKFFYKIVWINCGENERGEREEERGRRREGL